MCILNHNPKIDLGGHFRLSLQVLLRSFLPQSGLSVLSGPQPSSLGEELIFVIVSENLRFESTNHPVFCTFPRQHCVRTGLDCLRSVLSTLRSTQFCVFPIQFCVFPGKDWLRSLPVSFFCLRF